MATLADSLVSSAARKLGIRMRPDLTAARQRYQGRSYWVVKEPVGLNYFRFHEEEYAILQMLDGQSSLDDIKARFEAMFPPEKITVEEIQQFIGTLHRSGLVIADMPGQGLQLKKRRDERRRKELTQAATNILAIRFKGIDPDRILNWMYPKVRWFFHPATVITCLLFGLAALLLVAVQFDVFKSRLPSFHQFFTPANFIWLSIILGVTKVIHEFGHGLTCKHFGGECHEMGLMILVLTPCLYCNVSDSWMLPNKWHRAAIGAAGMYFEVVIATICTFVWWFTEPGLLNYLALSTMFVCSVSTLLFNANPLLRYDGYYILSDIMEIPNLRQKATNILTRKLGHWCLGIEPPDDPFLPQRNQMLFALYSVAAAVYRWVVVFSILFFLYKVFEPYRLQIIGQIIGAMSLYGLIVMPIYKVGKFFYVPGRLRKVKKTNLLATLGVVGIIIGIVGFLPLPYYVLCSFEVAPRDETSVYVDVPGELEEVLISPGQQVRQGDTLARLSNSQLELELVNLQSKADEYRTQIESLRMISLRVGRTPDRDAGSMKFYEESLAGVLKQIAEKNSELDSLILRANSSGAVIPPPFTPSPPDADGQLPGWSGTPLDKRNLGCLLEEGTLFCHLGDPNKMQAKLVIDQADMLFVRPGQTTEVMLDELPGTIFTTEISEIATTALKVSPRNLSNKVGGELATKTDAAGREVPQSASYEASAPLDLDSGLLRSGLKGQAKIHAGTQTIAQRAWRLITSTFNFEL